MKVTFKTATLRYLLRVTLRTVGKDGASITSHVMLTAAGLAVVAAALTYRVWSVGFLLAYGAILWLVDTNVDARFQHALRPETRATVASVKGFANQCGTSLLMLNFGLIAQGSSYQAAFLGYGVLLAALGAGYASWAATRRT